MKPFQISDLNLGRLQVSGRDALVGHARCVRETAVALIAPGVVGTDEALGRAGSGRDRHAPMTADVGENSDFAVVAAHDQQRFTENMGGEIVAGFRDLVGAAEAVPLALEQCLDFVGEVGRGCIEVPGQSPCFRLRESRNFGEFAIHVPNHGGPRCWTGDGTKQWMSKQTACFASGRFADYDPPGRRWFRQGGRGSCHWRLDHGAGQERKDSQHEEYDCMHAASPGETASLADRPSRLTMG